MIAKPSLHVHAHPVDAAGVVVQFAAPLAVRTPRRRAAVAALPTSSVQPPRIDAVLVMMWTLLILGFLGIAGICYAIFMTDPVSMPMP